MQVTVFTRDGVEGAMRYAFDAARRRNGYVVNATKSNGIYHTMPFWDRVFDDVAHEYPDVRTDSIHLDALLALLIRDPSRFDVIVASNLFGDLLTDLTAALMGSIGLAPSGNLNVVGDMPSMFEPVHGSAPDIVGQGIANPLGQVWAAVMMLEHLGATDSASALLTAMEGAIADDCVTPDMGGLLSTADVGRAVVRRIQSLNGHGASPRSST
jgi:tartrate dehydrogenase/decarboxylase/D-malate dehydrogenase